MKKKFLLALILIVVGVIYLGWTSHKNIPTFSEFNFMEKTNFKKPASIPKQSRTIEKKAGLPPRKIQATIAKYNQLKDLPSNLIKLKSVDHLAQKFRPERKSSLGEKAQLSLEVLPSHHYLDREIDKVYSIRITTRYKGIPSNAKLILQDENSHRYPVKVKAKGIYEIKIDAHKLKIGKTYFNIIAQAQDDEASVSLSLLVHPHYFDFLSSQDQGLDGEGNLFFSNLLRFKKRGNYLVEGTLYLNGLPYAQTSKLLRNVSGQVEAILNFHGYLFYRNKVSGSFELKGIQVTKIDSALKSHGDQYISIHQQTSKFNWDQFNSRPYFNEVVHDKIRKLTQNGESFSF